MKYRCYVFSYNRGKFLENCLDSLENLATEFFEITVIDDNSYDKKTKSVLRKYSEKFEVLNPGKQNISSKTGGLYDNMNFAFQDAVDRDVDFALFIQDDMQIVRKILGKDIHNIEEFFDRNPNSVQLHTCFLKRCKTEYDENSSLDKSKKAYFRKDNAPYAFFSAVGLFHVKRFKKLFGKLEQGEVANNEKAKSKGLKMGLYVYPFMMWLPMPISYRAQKRSFYHKVKEFIAKAGYYPYEGMSKPNRRRLFNRPIEKRPYAEDYLSPSTVKHIDQWSFTGVDSAFSELGGWRSKLAKLLMKIKQIIKLS